MTNGEMHVSIAVLFATPMTRGEYNALRGWETPANEDPSDEGYLVEREGTPNHPKYRGYISWSPADVFKRACRPSGQMPFGAALALMRNGARVARRGWNRQGMFLVLAPGGQFTATDEPLLGIYPEGATIKLRIATGEIVPWLAGQTDMLAEDWYVVDALSFQARGV